VPLSRWTFSLLEVTTDAWADEFRDNPLIPITPWLVGPSGLTLEPADPVLSEADPEALPVGEVGYEDGYVGPVVVVPPMLPREPPPLGGIPPAVPDMGSLPPAPKVGEFCKGRPMACTAACRGSSWPSFMMMRSKATPTIESGDSLL